MSISYNVTGKRRKALVKAMSEYLEADAVYNGAPTFAYTAGIYTIDKHGTVSYPEHASRELAERMAAALAERGFHAQAGETAENDNCPDNPVTEEMPDEAETCMEAGGVPAYDAGDSNRLTVEVSRDGFSDEALENLRKIIASKETVIKKALGLNDLPVNGDCLTVRVLEDKLCFAWFTLSGIDGEADAYSRFAYALCNMAKTQKRVTAKEQDSENHKFTMRVFLIRLGLKGPENKLVRQLMLKNLSGNSSWKSGQRPVKAAESTDSDSGDAACEAPKTMADAQPVHDVNLPAEQNDIGEKQ